MSLVIKPVKPTIGAEVQGADVVNLTDEQFAQIRQALVDYQVIFLRDQPALTEEMHLAFAERFAPVHIHPAIKGHMAQGHEVKYPGLMKFHADAKSKTVAGNRWHTDVSHDECPPLASILQMRVIPEAGAGDTLFASMYAAYDALSDRMKVMLDGLTAHHCGVFGAVNRGRQGSQRKPDNPNPGNMWTEADHPVVRKHPDTGRPALFVNHEFTAFINGLPSAEADALLHFLCEHVQNPNFQCRFEWTENAIAIWDNRCVQHFAVWDYFPAERLGHRVTTVGEKPIMYSLADTPVVETRRAAIQ